MTTAERCKGMTWQQVRDAGLLGALIAETGYGYKRLGKLMDWPRSQAFREACQAEVGKGTEALKPEFPVLLSTMEKEAEITGIASDLGNTVYRYLHNHAAERTTVAELSTKFDRSEASVREAIAEIRAAGYAIDLHEQDDGATAARMARSHPAHRGRVVATKWGESRLLLGYLSDTHYGNTHCCEEEIQWAYDKFAQEGVTEVLHTGDLVDGSGSVGFPGHDMEVYDGCQTPYALAAYVSENYPRRDGITTHFIESAKSHAGWDLVRTGFDYGYSLSNGWRRIRRGPHGSEWVNYEGRRDMHFLGHDHATLTCGPERNTRIHLHHPDGGTAYALSYQPQKWAESLEGGAKPHVALLGHYHKLNWIRERNIQVITGECMCWQTPFMRRKRIAAHVGFYILEMTVDADGTVRSFLPREFPFFLGEKRTFDLGAGEAA